MKILVVAATKPEVARIFEDYGLADEDFVQTPKFDLLITGVGIAATAFALGRYLGQQYSLVLNVGIAGSFDRTLPLGSLVNITSDIFAELGAENGDRFISIDQLGFGKSKYMASFMTKNPLITNLLVVNGITVNKVHGNLRSIALTLERLNVHTESMEGAAVFYACDQFHVPSLQVRSISNYIELRNKANWEIGLAITTLNNWLVDFLKLSFKS
ncbi:MAG: futalosine hydrolase [Bacteroidota bacterium]